MNDFDPGPWRALRPEERSDTAPGYMEFARQNFEDAQRVSNFDAHWANYYDAFNSVNDRIKTATRASLENPVSSSQGPGAAAEALVAFSREGVQQMTPVQAWTRSDNELRAKHADAVPWDDLIDEPHRVAWAKMKEVRERTDLMTEQAGLLQGKDVPLVGSIPKAGPAIGTFVAFPYNLVTSPGYTASQLAGSLAGQMTSPVDASVNLLSFGAGGAAKSLLKNMVLNASVNAVGQAPLSAPKQMSYKSAGLPYGVEVWLNEVAGAGATGGALDLSIRGPSLTDEEEWTDAKVGFTAISVLQVGMKDALGMEFQLTGVDYTKDNFVHADMTAEEFEASMKERGESFSGMMLNEMGKSMASQQKQNPLAMNLDMMMSALSSDRGYRMRRIFAVQLVKGGEGDAFASFDGASTIITERNKKCLAVMDRELKKGHQKIGNFYGAGHFADMEKRMVNEHGFQRKGEEWIVAWHLRDPKEDTAKKPEAKK